MLFSNIKTSVLQFNSSEINPFLFISSGVIIKSICWLVFIGQFAVQSAAATYKHTENQTGEATNASSIFMNECMYEGT